MKPETRPTGMLGFTVVTIRDESVFFISELNRILWLVIVGLMCSLVFFQQLPNASSSPSLRF